MPVSDAVLARLPHTTGRAHFQRADSRLGGQIAANWSPVIRKVVASSEVYAAMATGPFSIGVDGGIGTVYGAAGDVIVYDPSTGTFSKASADELETLFEANDEPVVTMTAEALAFVEGDGPTVVDAGLTITDADTANLTSATVAITANYDDEEDVLDFTDGDDITGSWDAAEGVLTLSGEASVADYQAALRTVTFDSIGTPPTSELERTVTVTVTDTQSATASDTRGITVAAAE